MRTPMLEKTVDNAIGGCWHIFGVHDTGNVDIANATDDVFTDLPKDLADKVIEAHDQFREHLYKILCK